MSCAVTILGEHPLARDSQGKLKSRIGTAFPRSNALVTLPGIHASQRQAFLDFLNQKREAAGQEPLSRHQEHVEWNNAVDLILEDNTVQIRPDPGNMALAFEADELLQELVPKHRIKFLGVLNEKVRDAIQQRGEWWRITMLPKSLEEMKQMILASRIALGGKEIYYYSRSTGVHLLTCQQFAGLGRLDDAALRDHLLEIQRLSARVNSHGHPELALFAAGPAFSKADLARHDFHDLDPERLRAALAALCREFLAAVPPELREDDPDNVEWRNRMVAALIGHEDQTIPEETLLGLSPEFFMQIEWLPGGRIEEGELVFDSILADAGSEDDEDLKRLSDEKPQKFIYNFVREYGDLEHVNIGRVIGSLSRRPVFYGRRDVYIAVLKQRESDKEIVRIIRMQKRGVREYLDEGYELHQAMSRSEEYTEYILDRRLGCRQLGMNLPTRVTARRISEQFVTPGGETLTLWCPYFERDYIRGFATDKLPPHRFANEEFALRCAHLLGRAAAPNLIVGRSDLAGNPLFDDGDEVLIEDAEQMPVDIVVADHTGTFNDYLSDLTLFASEYAGPINRRIALVADPRRFTEAYLEAFVGRFTRIQEEYRKRRKAFDTLFKYSPTRAGGGFALRWEKVLERLDRTDPHAVAARIREQVVLRQ
jgi:hypothetical protein